MVYYFSEQAKVAMVGYSLLSIAYFIELFKENKNIDYRIANYFISLIPIVISIYTINCIVLGVNKGGLPCNVLSWINSVSILVCSVLILVVTMYYGGDCKKECEFLCNGDSQCIEECETRCSEDSGIGSGKVLQKRSGKVLQKRSGKGPGEGSGEDPGIESKIKNFEKKITDEFNELESKAESRLKKLLPNNIKPDKSILVDAPKGITNVKSISGSEHALLN
jgi:hypothetical protein